MGLQNRMISSKLFRNCGFEAVLVKNLDSPPPKLRCRFQRLGEEEDELQSEPGLLVELNRKLDASRALPPALSVAMAMADGHRAQSWASWTVFGRRGTCGSYRSGRRSRLPGAVRRAQAPDGLLRRRPLPLWRHEPSPPARETPVGASPTSLAASFLSTYSRFQA